MLGFVLLRPHTWMLRTPFSPARVQRIIFLSSFVISSRSIYSLYSTMRCFHISLRIQFFYLLSRSLLCPSTFCLHLCSSNWLSSILGNSWTFQNFASSSLPSYCRLQCQPGFLLYHFFTSNGLSPISMEDHLSLSKLCVQFLIAFPAVFSCRRLFSSHLCPSNLVVIDIYGGSLELSEFCIQSITVFSSLQLPSTFLATSRTSNRVVINNIEGAVELELILKAWVHFSWFFSSYFVFPYSFIHDTYLCHRQLYNHRATDPPKTNSFPHNHPSSLSHPRTSTP